jgi:hypothetical protein
MRWTRSGGRRDLKWKVDMPPPGQRKRSLVSKAAYLILRHSSGSRSNDIVSQDLADDYMGGN